MHRTLTLVKGKIGYAQQDFSLNDYQTTKYRINELTEFMDAYTLNYLTQGTSEILFKKKFYCLNLSKQQEREYKSQQKIFTIPFDVSKFTEKDKDFLTMFNFEHTKLTQTQFEKLAQLLTQFQKYYATSKFDAGKNKVELNLPLRATAIFKKQRATRIPLQIQDRVQHLLDILTHFDIISPVNTHSSTTGNTFINPVIILKKGESLKIVLDANQLNTMIDETKCSWPIEPIQVILTRIKGPIFSIADMNSTYNQMPPDKPSQRLTNFVIAGQEYCFKRLFYGISIGPAALSSFMSSMFKPLNRKKTK